MIRILSISSVIPYDGVPHAGGKTYNTYIKSVVKDGSFDVSVLAFSKKKDLLNNDFDKYGIKNFTEISSGSLFIDIIHFVLDVVGKIDDYGKCYSEYKKCMVMRRLKLLSIQKQLPDIVELEWTDMALLARNIKKNYPKIKVIASEHDVTFLGAYRRYRHSNGKKKKIMKKRYDLIKQLELDAINTCDVVITHNCKDSKLLLSNGIEKDKIFTIVPYYHDMKSIKRKNNKRDILFWGAMGRSENAEACRWFIENVMPLLNDINIRFVIAGNNPPDDLIRKRSERIIVTGFIEDETALFENSLCFVCPLINGAGIKVKILEAMSSGIPVLTNDIGIEGIPGEDGVSYFNCNTAEQYTSIIKKLINNNDVGDKMGKIAKKVLEEHFNLDDSIKNYINMLKNV